MRRSLGDVLSDRDNALTVVRVVLAAVVVVAHSPSVSGLGHHPEIGGVGLGSWAVFGFFGISGYVVAQSRFRHRTSEFFAHRALRILPAFWVVNVLTAAVAAPLAALIAGTSFDPASAVGYVVRNAGIVMNQWEIGGTLGTAPFTQVWNGSLWTLASEVSCYVVVGIVFAAAGARAHLTAVSFVGVVLLASLAFVGASFAILGTFFAAGVFVFSLRDRLRISPVLLAAAALLVVASVVLHHVALLAPLPLGYLVLSAAALPAPAVARRGDVSYGLYIYAFPVQQLLAVSGVPRQGLAVYTVLSLAVTVPLAWLSWRVVEAPALRLRQLLRTGSAPGPETSTVSGVAQGPRVVSTTFTTAGNP